jgi:two-component system, NtrC family, response regulator PilR
MSARVLAVDDEVDFLATYERLLRRQGYEVTAVSSCASALAILAAERSSLVISDLQLGDGDGMDVVRAARAGPHPVPVIVVTGYPSEERRRTALAEGATAFFAKPFLASALLATVRIALVA